MKKILFSIIFVFAVAAASASETADTVITFSNPMSVTVSESREAVKVAVVDGDTVTTVITQENGGNAVHRSTQQFRFPRGGNNWAVITGGFVLGFVNTPGSGDEVSPEGGKSLELGITNIIGIQREFSSSAALSLGIGVDWRNYRSTKGLMYVADNGRVGVSRFPLGTDYRFSRLKIFSLQFPLLMTFKFKGNIAGLYPNLAFGPVFCWNTHGSLKSSWREADGSVATYTDNHIGQRKFTIDLMARASLGYVGLYVRYSPYKALTGGGAPDFRPLSAGVSLFF